MLTKLKALYARLSKDAQAAIVDAVKAAGFVLVALPTASLVLAGLHVPAGDIAILSSVSAVLTGFVSWAVRNRLAPAAKK